uniref:Uncharacterized protein n=1 Tax=Setaria viridis TaxID=4556 RepID=A0A4U6WB94_SETVI|nr:hypothetical protein SEVIR_1G209500v2 [Setaria viridis]
MAPPNLPQRWGISALLTSMLLPLLPSAWVLGGADSAQVSEVSTCPTDLHLPSCIPTISPLHSNYLIPFHALHIRAVLLACCPVIVL